MQLILVNKDIPYYLLETFFLNLFKKKKKEYSESSPNKSESGKSNTEQGKKNQKIYTNSTKLEP